MAQVTRPYSAKDEQQLMTEMWSPEIKDNLLAFVMFIFPWGQKGTPLENVEDLDQFDFVRTIAVARIMMPSSAVRLSAGREEMNEQTQALCFLAGANSIFYGEKLLTTKNPEVIKDQELFNKLGINKN